MLTDWGAARSSRTPSRLLRPPCRRHTGESPRRAPPTPSGSASAARRWELPLEGDLLRSHQRRADRSAPERAIRSISGAKPRVARGGVPLSTDRPAPPLDDLACEGVVRARPAAVAADEAPTACCRSPPSAGDGASRLRGRPLTQPHHPVVRAPLPRLRACRRGAQRPQRRLHGPERLGGDVREDDRAALDLDESAYGCRSCQGSVALSAATMCPGRPDSPPSALRS